MVRREVADPDRDRSAGRRLRLLEPRQPVGPRSLRIDERSPRPACAVARPASRARAPSGAGRPVHAAPGLRPGVTADPPDHVGACPARDHVLAHITVAGAGPLLHVDQQRRRRLRRRRSTSIGPGAGRHPVGTVQLPTTVADPTPAWSAVELVGAAEPGRDRAASAGRRSSSPATRTTTSRRSASGSAAPDADCSIAKNGADVRRDRSGAGGRELVAVPGHPATASRSAFARRQARRRLSGRRPRSTSRRRASTARSRRAFLAGPATTASTLAPRHGPRDRRRFDVKIGWPVRVTPASSRRAYRRR